MRNLVSSLLLIIFSSCFIFLKCKKDDPIPTPPDEIKEGLHLGLVGFNSDVTITPMTNNITQINKAIDSLQNTVDATALCYGIKKGLDLLEDLDRSKDLDNSYIVVFTDGFDNYSAKYFQGVFQNDVVPYTQNILKNARITNDSVSCYTIGLEGRGTLKESELINLAVNGEYKKANSSTLQATFKSIANSLITTSKNLSIVTNAVPISTSYPKYIQITLNTTLNSDGSGVITPYVIEGSLTNIDGRTPIFTVINCPSNITFIGSNGYPITGNIEKINNIDKAVMPLKNLTVIDVASSKISYVKDIRVKIKYDLSNPYLEDVEDSYAQSKVGKNVAISLVLDCSSSLGSDFTPMKQYVKEFINIVKEAK